MATRFFPEWVVPSDRAVIDCCEFAAARSEAGEGHFFSAVECTITWLVGRPVAPVSELPVQPTLAEAKAEWHLAGAMLRGVELPAEIFQVLGVAPREENVPSRDWATGAGLALGWLLGQTQENPLERLQRARVTAPA